MTTPMNEQSRLTTLRLRELRGEATEAERAEIAAMLASIEAREAKYLQPVTEQVRQENAAKRIEVETIQKQNKALEMVLLEHKQLVADAKLFLVEMDNRHQHIHDRYARLTGKALTVA